MPLPFLIGDAWVEGAGEPLVSINPADGSVNAEVATASAAEVDQAVSAAAEVLRRSGWPHLKPHERARYLRRVARAIADEVEKLAITQMRENGKVIAECRAQAASAAATFDYYAAVCETLGSEVTPPRGPYVSMTVYEPMGVVAAITPWNSPLTMMAQKLAPALAAGNAVILKPSEVTPLSALEFGRVCLAAGLPPGLVGVLPGTGAVVGAGLVRHPGVRMVSFTGGTQTGRAIAQLAAEALKPVALELGGKSPNIVFADADLDRAAAGVVGGIFGSAGQSCVAGSRLFVQASIHDGFVERVLDRTRALRLGPPDAPDVEIGPLASFPHRERVERYVASARAEGAGVLIGGGRPDGERFARGAYYLPTVLAGLDNRATACREEIFGPVLCVLPFSDEADLVAQANDTAYGLACGIWTADYEKAWRVARAIDAGTVWINTYKQLSISTPFGGFKESGLGREKGTQGMRLYQQAKSIYWGLSGPRGGAGG